MRSYRNACARSARRRSGEELGVRTILMLLFWAAALPVAALLGFPWTYLTKDINFCTACACSR